MKVVTISSCLNFGRPDPPGRGSATGRNFLARLTQPACSVCVSLSAFFHFISISFRSLLNRQRLSSEKTELNRTASLVSLRETGVRGGRGPHSKVCPLWPPNEVHHADIVTEVYAIASLELQAQICQ